MRYDSPLRYPGGKASLASLLARTIELNDLRGCTYFEPFAGGAGAALRLLREKVVSEIRINDLDARIIAFWNAILGERERFVENILSVPLSVAEWESQREIYRRGDTSKEFELGFATFYLNRCNRSGVLFRAAPIGGHEQTGKWKIDARFNRAALAERVIAISGRAREHSCHQPGRPRVLGPPSASWDVIGIASSHTSIPHNHSKREPSLPESLQGRRPRTACALHATSAYAQLGYVLRRRSPNP